jgi:aspartate aminotransferase
MDISLPFERADRIKTIEVSTIVQLTERVSSLVSSGRDVITFATGEPDFPTPGYIIDAAHHAALDGHTRYTATVGIKVLRERIATISNSEFQQVIVSTGAKQVLANAMWETLNNGDEVIVPAPYWVSYWDIVAIIAGGTPVSVPCAMSNNFKLTPALLEGSITSK